MVLLIIILITFPSLAGELSYWKVEKKGILDSSWNINDLKKHQKVIPVKTEFRDFLNSSSSPTHYDGAKIKIDGTKSIELSGERGSGGGGDLLKCPGDPTRYYSLDYFLSDHRDIDERLLSQTQCHRVIQSIHQHLQKHNPVLAAGLAGFMREFNNYSAWKGDRSFVFQTGRIIQIRDEEINKKICRGGQIFQTAIRFPLPRFVHYSIDIDAFLSIKDQPLQCSYFLLHEWARDFLWKASKNRQFVHYLHSKDFFYSKENKLPFFGPKRQKALNVKSENSAIVYKNFLNRFGDVAHAKANLIKGLKYFNGKYRSVDRDGCNHKLDVKLAGPYDHFDAIISTQTLKTKGINVCTKRAGQTLKFKCHGYLCTPLNPKPISIVGCKHPLFQIRLEGLYNIFSIELTCGKKVRSSKKWVKSELYREFKRAKTNFDRHR
jgi:hypothetical protein